MRQFFQAALFKCCIDFIKLALEAFLSWIFYKSSFGRFNVNWNLICHQIMLIPLQKEILNSLTSAHFHCHCSFPHRQLPPWPLTWLGCLHFCSSPQVLPPTSCGVFTTDTHVPNSRPQGLLWWTLRFQKLYLLGIHVVFPWFKNNEL